MDCLHSQDIFHMWSFTLCHNEPFFKSLHTNSLIINELKKRKRKKFFPPLFAPYSGIATVTPALAEADKKASCLFVKG